MGSWDLGLEGQPRLLTWPACCHDTSSVHNPPIWHVSTLTKVSCLQPHSLQIELPSGGSSSASASASSNGSGTSKGDSQQAQQAQQEQQQEQQAQQEQRQEQQGQQESVLTAKKLECLALLYAYQAMEQCIDGFMEGGALQVSS